MRSDRLLIGLGLLVLQGAGCAFDLDVLRGVTAGDAGAAADGPGALDGSVASADVATGPTDVAPRDQAASSLADGAGAADGPTTVDGPRTPDVAPPPPDVGVTPPLPDANVTPPPADAAVTPPPPDAAVTPPPPDAAVTPPPPDAAVTPPPPDAASPEAGGNPDGTITENYQWSHTSCDQKAIPYPYGPFPPGSCPPPASQTIACPGNSKITVQTATASNWETGYNHPPAHAIDQYPATRWSSHSGPTAWFVADLGAVRVYQRIHLTWEIAYATDYDLETSNDGATWTTLKAIRGGNGFVDSVDVEGNSRYIRMRGITRGPNSTGQLFGYSLFDFTVCGERP